MRPDIAGQPEALMCQKRAGLWCASPPLSGTPETTLLAQFAMSGPL